LEKLNNIHPGEILLEEFLIPMEIPVFRKLSKAKEELPLIQHCDWPNILEHLRSFGSDCKMISIWKKAKFRKQKN